MNERIKELMAQARTSFNNTGSYFTQELLMEKFAELIVRECAGIVQPYMSRWEEDCDLVIKIKQHFGVEE